MMEVPHFTKYGLKKKKMPKGLHSYLLASRNESNSWREICYKDNANYDCRENMVVNMKMLGKNKFNMLFRIE